MIVPEEVVDSDQSQRGDEAPNLGKMVSDLVPEEYIHDEERQSKIE